jgi:carboxypeptidase family protein
VLPEKQTLNSQQESDSVKSRKAERLWLFLVVAVCCWSLSAVLRGPGLAHSEKVPGHRSNAALAPTSSPGIGRLSSVAGVVTDPRSQPIAKARVCAVVAGTIAASTAGICAETDVRGQYAIPGLLSGSYLVTAARDGYVTGSARGGQSIDLPGQTASTEVDIVLQPGGAQVSGLVLDAIGGSVPHATIRAERVAHRGWRSTSKLTIWVASRFGFRRVPSSWQRRPTGTLRGAGTVRRPVRTFV